MKGLVSDFGWKFGEGVSCDDKSIILCVSRIVIFCLEVELNWGIYSSFFLRRLVCK